MELEMEISHLGVISGIYMFMFIHTYCLIFKNKHELDLNILKTIENLPCFPNTLIAFLTCLAGLIIFDFHIIQENKCLGVMNNPK